MGPVRPSRRPQRTPSGRLLDGVWTAPGSQQRTPARRTFRPKPPALRRPLGGVSNREAPPFRRRGALRKTRPGQKPPKRTSETRYRDPLSQHSDEDELQPARTTACASTRKRDTHSASDATLCPIIVTLGVVSGSRAWAGGWDKLGHLPSPKGSSGQGSATSPLQDP